MNIIIVKVKEEKILPKLYQMLEAFNSNEIDVSTIIKPKKKNKILNKADIEKRWREIVYTSVGDFPVNDDDYLMENLWRDNK